MIRKPHDAIAQAGRGERRGPAGQVPNFIRPESMWEGEGAPPFICWDVIDSWNLLTAQPPVSLSKRGGRQSKNIERGLTSAPLVTG